jgi:6-phosphogluconolactonase (cycloisomerase 2 family)
LVSRVALILLVCASGLGQKMPEDPTLVYIGTAGAKSKGIYLFRLQSQGDEVFQNVTLVPLGLAADTPNPSFIELDLKRRLLFAASDVEEGSIKAFAIGPAGKLTLVNQASSNGRRPCQLALDRSGRRLLVANCGSASASLLHVGADGRIGEEASSVRLTEPSVPCVAFDPEGRFAFICDQASDKVLIFRVNADTGMLTVNQPAGVSLKTGSGPRRILFRPDGRFAYVVNERTSTVDVFAFDNAAGTLTHAQSVSTLPEYFDGPNAAGEVGVHRSARWLYVSNSGHNSVVLFTIDKEKGTLTFVEEQGTGGKNPRFFGIEPSSKHLAISNTDSDTVLASRIDDGNGRLKPSGIFANLAAPASVRFLPPVSDSGGSGLESWSSSK